MSSCHDMKKGEIYVCEDCNLELQVISECDHSCGDDDCTCHDDGGECALMCCNKPLKKKD
jgi:hypothetical protein